MKLSYELSKTESPQNRPTGLSLSYEGRRGRVIDSHLLVYSEGLHYLSSHLLIILRVICTSLCKHMITATLNFQNFITLEPLFHFFLQLLN